jgi:hypothetical protein
MAGVFQGDESAQHQHHGDDDTQGHFEAKTLIDGGQGISFEETRHERYPLPTPEKPINECQGEDPAGNPAAQPFYNCITI